MTSSSFLPELPDWLALLHLPELGPSALQRLHVRFGSPDCMFSAPASAVASVLNEKQSEALFKLANGRWPETVRAKVEADLDWQSAPDRAVLLFEDPRYPALLREIPDPPPLLFARGRMDFLGGPTLAMVGTRKPSASGRRMARRFAAALGGAGLQICSGLAVGIDGESHRGALEGGGHTIAVLGSGLDRVYPARHGKLAAAIATGKGVLLSEFPRHCGAQAWHFPRRNRIVTGLSLGVLVVEAALKSGSLISARCALEQGREVFAMPGPVDNLQSQGCHALIRDGATLVESPADIGDCLQHWCPPPTKQVSSPDNDEALTPDERKLLDVLGYEALKTDQLALLSGLNPARLMELLSRLELKGQIEREGGAYRRVQSF